jgi:hypothetical protein
LRGFALHLRVLARTLSPIPTFENTAANVFGQPG